LPETRNLAGNQSRFLETQADGQQGPGSPGQPDVARAGVAGGENLGTRFAQASPRFAANSPGVDFTTKNTKSQKKAILFVNFLSANSSAVAALAEVEAFLTAIASATVVATADVTFCG
jgi:GrpB-like predicted nucleotidyltransferase (UPF0157 family)